jgi:hypothetical protein
MFAKKALVAVLVGAGLLATAAAPQPAYAAVEVYVNSAPPPERYERVPKVRRGYVWAPGYWDYRGNRHVWVKGREVKARHGYVYQPNRWVERDGRWSLERSRWDRDGDGVPNRRDAHPNNPNRR